MNPLPPALAALCTDHAGLGLTPGQVEVVEHNSEWPGLAAAVADHIHGALDDVQVEHIGSTSVPDLAAKPLLDIAVGIEPTMDQRQVISSLEACGFQFELDLGMYGGLLFTVHCGESTVVAHVHVVSIDDFQWRWYLAFRDGLRADPELRSEYESLKQAAAADHAGDREGYTKAKFDWVLAAVGDLDEPPPLS